MGIDVSSLVTLANPTVSEIFKSILRWRTVSRYQLELEKPAQNVQKQDISRALQSLQDAGLIAKAAGNSEERDSFFPTTNGLVMEKYIQR